MKTLSKPQNQSKKVTSKRNIAKIIFGVAIASTVVGEILSRHVLGLGEPPLSVAHPTIEYMFKPNQNVNRFGNKIVINQYGMRSEDFSF